VLDDIAQVLYRLPELIDGVRAGKTVYHLEGPKDVETARGRLGVVATTSGSTSSWRPEFRAHYTGADVVVIPDNDTPGHKYADTVARDLLRVARSVKVVELPGLEEGGDLTDWLDAGHTSEEFLALVEESPAYGPEEEEPWPEPVPLEMKLPSVRALDALMVPEPLREWVLDTSRRMDNAPLDFAAAAAIVVAGALLGRKVGVRPKRNDDWTVIPNLWGGLVGLPASMKTPTLNQVLRPVKQLAAEARERHEEVLKEHELDMMVVSAERAALKKELEVTAKKVVSASASRGDLDGIRADLEDLEEPDPPTPRRYTTNDTSIEKMAELLMDNPDGLLLYRDELTGWLQSLDKAGHEAARAFYLEAWNGDGSHEVDRIGRGSLFVKAVCVSILGGIQPAVRSHPTSRAPSTTARAPTVSSSASRFSCIPTAVALTRRTSPPTSTPERAPTRSSRIWRTSTSRSSSVARPERLRRCPTSTSTTRPRRSSTTGGPPSRARSSPETTRRPSRAIS
jgi:hypothetical protein